MEKLDLHFPEVDKSATGELKKAQAALESEGRQAAPASKKGTKT
jgi:hypothetical protein